MKLKSDRSSPESKLRPCTAVSLDGWSPKALIPEDVCPKNHLSEHLASGKVNFKVQAI